MIPTKRYLSSKLPKFKIKIYLDNNNFAIILKKQYNNEIIGRLDLENIAEGIYETHFNVLDAYHNKGVGIYLISIAAELALFNQIKVVSSLTPSDKAVRLWKSSRLKKHYIVSKKDNRFLIKSKKKIKW